MGSDRNGSRRWRSSLSRYQRHDGNTAARALWAGMLIAAPHKQVSPQKLPGVAESWQFLSSSHAG
jgi:hypothetical protein